MNRNQIQIIIHGPKDHLGRQNFYAEWISDNVGPFLTDTGIRSQCFFCNLDEWKLNAESKGKQVLIVPENQSKAGYVLKENVWTKFDVHTWQPIS